LSNRHLTFSRKWTSCPTRLLIGQSNIAKKHPSPQKLSKEMNQKFNELPAFDFYVANIWSKFEHNTAIHSFPKALYVKISVKDESQKKIIVLTDDGVMQAIALEQETKQMYQIEKAAWIKAKNEKKMPKSWAKLIHPRKRNKTDYIASEQQPGP